MSDYSTTASITLSVNGQQARKMLTQLEKDAKRLEQGIDKAARAGDKATMKKLQRELTSTKRMMEQLRGAAASTDQTLRRLDKATPKELNNALKQLRRQLNGIERGTPAWDAHVAKIKAVKDELAKVNATMATQKSMWSRMNSWLNSSMTAILGVSASVTGLIMAGRKAVQAYADMEQEMANVRKFTGMSEDQVKSLNDELKKIDTRTSREELNMLAQQAGRLGKSSQEDVLGFVRAADKINVALDDLGENATLQLSKLTGIFGDEKRLGTEKALLSVGSVVNELSQNCSASAPYIAEFASRLGGVGSQAGMTVQQIMGFAAVLDSNNQKLEASSTALSQVIVRIFQDPAKYAKVAGLNVQKFTDLVKTDMNAALIEFLSALSKAGKMDTLSPMFKDMGENGSRAIAALSTLAGHIGEVVSQQEVANTAFEEAISIDKEFDVQNNTVQAGLDKSKKSINELAVELGEKLQPVMKLFMSSSRVAMEVLNSMVDFFIKYRREIIMLTASVAAYTVVAKGSMLATKAWGLVTSAVTAIANASKIAVMALRIGYYNLTDNIKKADAMTRIFNRTTKASPWGMIIGLVTAAAGALYSFFSRMKEAREETERQRKEMEDWKRSLTDIDAASAEYSAKEITRLKDLYNEATAEANAKDKRRAAAEKLQQLYPDYFKNLSVEEIMVGKAKSQYDSLTDSIINAAKARAAAAKIEDNEKQILELESKQSKLQQKQREQKSTVIQRQMWLEDVRDANAPALQSSALGDSREMNSRDVQSNVGKINKAQANLKEAKKELAATTTELDGVNSQLDSLNSANRELAEKYNVSSKTIEETLTPDATAYTPTTPSGGSGGKADKFAAEKDWRETQEAYARISYAKGETDYIDFTKRMDKIAVDFYKRQLEHTDLGDSERLKLEAEYNEAILKKSKDFTKFNADEMERAYNDSVAQAKQSYIDGEYSYQTYTEALERLELQHLETMANFYEEGSEEQLQAERQLQEKRLEQRRRHQKEYEDQEAKFASMKNDFFGDNPQEAQAKLDADLAMLQIVYDREIQAAGDNAAEKLRIEEQYEQAKLALKQKYGLAEAAGTRNALQKAVDDCKEWLESDGGKALTGTLNTLVSGMSAIFSQLTTSIQADLEIQTAAINKRYDAEISRAEGNTYKVKELERKKEKEVAKAKQEANRKMFAMQVIQAVAQTAQNAISAYGSAAAVPVVGYVLAPIAAAMAIAAGALQIANIKKQQQASEATGYAEGGFTPPGRKYDEAGVVHKGEWVASQRLVNNPRTRPLLEALDYAQRTNTIGSITNADVSRRIAAPMILAGQQASPVVVQPASPTVVVEQNSEYSGTMQRLAKRLDEPFVTIVTVEGDHGINKEKERYDKMMKNKSPKYKR